MSAPWTYPCPCAVCDCHLPPEPDDSSIYTETDHQRVCSEECRDEYEWRAGAEERAIAAADHARDVAKDDDAMCEKPKAAP